MEYTVRWSCACLVLGAARAYDTYRFQWLDREVDLRSESDARTVRGTHADADAVIRRRVRSGLEALRTPHRRAGPGRLHAPAPCGPLEGPGSLMSLVQLV